jgi:hypothetical protein
LLIKPPKKIDAQFTGAVELAMDLTVGVNFDINNAQLTFPPDDSSSPDSNAFSIGDTREFLVPVNRRRM